MTHLQPCVLIVTRDFMRDVLSRLTKIVIKIMEIGDGGDQTQRGAPY